MSSVLIRTEQRCITRCGRARVCKRCRRATPSLQLVPGLCELCLATAWCVVYAGAAGAAERGDRGGACCRGGSGLAGGPVAEHSGRARCCAGVGAWVWE